MMPKFNPYTSIGSTIFFIAALLFARFSYMLIVREINHSKPQKRPRRIR